MSKIELLRGSCADQNVDAIVNAANRNLWAGSGICGAIFSKAGYEELEEACSKIKVPLNDGDAVITPAFKITNAKYVIHAVGPNFSVTPDAYSSLFDAYYNSLLVLKEKDLHSISFPLISSGIFGGNLESPVSTSTEECISAYNRFISDYPDYNINVKLCAFTEKEYLEANNTFNNYSVELKKRSI